MKNTIKRLKLSYLGIDHQTYNYILIVKPSWSSFYKHRSPPLKPLWCLWRKYGISMVFLFCLMIKDIKMAVNTENTKEIGSGRWLLLVAF